MLQDIPRIFLFHLTWIILLGTGFTGWVSIHTDWIGVLSSMLSLGGILAWAAFFLGVLKDHRKEQMKDVIDALLCHRRTGLVLVALTLITFTTLSFFGSFTFESRESSRTHFIEVVPGKGKAEEVRMVAGGQTRYLVRTLWKPRQIWVRVEGLPDRQLKVSPFQTTKVILPHQLYRPLILIRGSLLLSQFENMKVTLERRTKGTKDWVLFEEWDDYDGSPIWLGCQDDVAIPDRIFERWQISLMANEGLDPGIRSAVLATWSQPIASRKHKDYELVSNDRFRIRFINKSTGAVLGEKEWPVNTERKISSSHLHDYVEVIEVPKL